MFLTNLRVHRVITSCGKLKRIQISVKSGPDNLNKEGTRDAVSHTYISRCFSYSLFHAMWIDLRTLPLTNARVRPQKHKTWSLCKPLYTTLQLLEKNCFRLTAEQKHFFEKLKNKRPTWCHLLFYFTSYVLNMFRTLMYPSSGACDYSVELPHWSYCSWFDVCWSFSVVGLEWYPCCRLSLLMCSTCFGH